jgi:hypothetical protein
VANAVSVSRQILSSSENRRLSPISSTQEFHEYASPGTKLIALGKATVMSAVRQDVISEDWWRLRFKGVPDQAQQADRKIGCCFVK